MQINNTVQFGIRKPKHFTIEQDKIELITEPYTDLWQRIYYHFEKDIVPLLQLKTSKDFSFIVKTELEKISNPSTKIINGLQIKTPNNVVIEFDHVIITKQNVFTIETKAFGINQEGIEDNCSIIISDNKDWLKIGKTKILHKIPSPMKQLQKQHSIMSAILKEFKVVPKNILIIANKNARIKGKIKDNNFSIVTIDNLISTITEECTGKNIKVFEILNKMDSLRIN